MKFYLFIFILLICISSINASTYNNCEIYGNCKTIGTTTSISSTNSSTSNATYDAKADYNSTEKTFNISRNNSIIPSFIIEMPNIQTDWSWKSAFALSNPSQASASVTRQMPPSLEFWGNEWVSSASQTQKGKFICRGGSGENEVYCSIMVKKGAGSWLDAFTVLSNGAITSSNSMYTYGIGESIKLQFRFYNGKASTSGTNEYSPTFQFYGSGWNGTASRVMSTGFLEAPETGTKESEGIFKFIHGNNLWVGGAWNVSETNETMRLLHGDKWGVEFNHYNITNFTVSINGLLQLRENITSMICNVNNAGIIYYDGTLNKHFGCNSTTWNGLY